jgi:NADH-quinone oxidoreductase subunit N
MTFSFTVTAIDWWRITPELAVFGAALLVLMADLVVPEGRKGWLAILSLLGLAGGYAATISLYTAGNGFSSSANGLEAFNNMISADYIALFGYLVILSASTLAMLMSPAYLKRQGIRHQGEYYALMLLATSGMMLMAAATNLMTIFLGLELLSLALYILSGFVATRFKSQEAGMKYFLLSSFASAFLLYGMALVYGSTGSTALTTIGAFLRGPRAPAAQIHGPFGFAPLLGLGMGLLAVGFAFKVSAIPFHAWTPDVYEGAPTTVTAFMSVGTKAAAFLALARTFMLALHTLQNEWSGTLWAIAVVTMILGNLMVVAQTDVKRLLAYSSIAHAGYMLVGIVVNTQLGLSAVLFYLMAYAFMNVGAFGIVLALEHHGGAGTNLRDYAGLKRTHPLLAATMALFMFALAGVPGTVGFMAKYYIFYAAIQGGHLDLAIIGLVSSVFGFFYYLRVVFVMYGREPAAATEAEPAADRVPAPVGAPPTDMPAEAASASTPARYTAISLVDSPEVPASGTTSVALPEFPAAAPGAASGISGIQAVAPSVSLALLLAAILAIGLGIAPAGITILAHSPLLGLVP